MYKMNKEIKNQNQLKLIKSKSKTYNALLKIT